jgi:outer membrane protein OmpA-like peptidoglycan-associated protein
LRAESALRGAEETYRTEGASPEARDLAYVAERRARAAEAWGAAAGNAEANVHTQALVLQMERRRSIEAATQLETLKDTLRAKEVTESQRKTLAVAGARTRARLRRMGMNVREDPRGTVITLPSTLYFVAHEPALLPDARKTLKAVAWAISTDARPIEVSGHTDTAGNDKFNDRLSEGRARAVRAALLANGIPAARVQAFGEGSRVPVADERSGHGRWRNRRVEIVLCTLDESGDAREASAALP